MQLARELKMTLGDLRVRITEEEMILWSLLFEQEKAEQQRAEQKMRMRR